MTVMKSGNSAELEAFRHRDSPVGRFMRYAQARIRQFIPRQIMTVFGSVVVGAYVSIELGVVLFALAIFGELFDLAILIFLKRQRAETLAKPWAFRFAAFGSFVQSLCFCLCIGFAWVAGGHDLRAYCIAFFVAATLNAGIVTNFLPFASITRMATYTSAICVLLVTDIMRLGWQSRILQLDVLAFAMLATTVGIFLVYFLKLQSKHMSSAGDLLTEKQAVQDALRTKEAFLSSASHQFRTPLNGIMASADLLNRNNPRADQQALIQPLRSSAADLAAMIHDILDVTQLEKGGLMIDLKELDIRTCLSEIIETYRDRAVAKAIRYDVEFIGDFPATVMGDGDRITQILSKTLANAVHFTRSGGVSVLISCRSFKTSCVIFVTIKDSGPGMDPERLKSIFSDTHGSDGRMDAGLGLGLRIARHAARQMGGALSIDSTVGIGTTSKLTLNLATVEAGPAKPDWKLSEASVLVAEDNKTNQLIVKKLLEPTGVKLHFADDGVAAVAGFQTLQPDLILMDLAMPNKTGLEAAEEIRALEAGMSLPTTPIIALTANAFEEDRRNCERVGMNGFLTKPVNQKRLISELERAGQSRAP